MTPPPHLFLCVMRFERFLRPGALVGAFAVAVLLGGAARPSAVSGPTVSVDTDTSGNGANAVGTIEPCSSIASTGTSISVDIVIRGVTSLSGFEADLFYNASIVSVTGENGAMFLNRGFFFDLSDPTPDTDGRYHMVIATSGFDSGDGVIVRLTLQGNAIGISALSLANIKLKDSSNNVVQPADAQGFYIGPVNSGSVAIGVPCGSDSDADGVPDSVDLCPGTASGAAVDANGCAQAQVDGDLDGICDPGEVSTWCTGSDNCPAVANPAQTNTDGDSMGDACDPEDDGDGYLDTTEAWVGTNPLDNCGSHTTTPPIYSQAWPADLYSAAGSAPPTTDKVNVLDLTSYLAPVRIINTSPGDAAYNKRWDLLPGAGPFAKDINVADITNLVTVAPDMFGGVRAFNGPTCTP